MEMIQMTWWMNIPLSQDPRSVVSDWHLLVQVPCCLFGSNLVLEQMAANYLIESAPMNEEICDRSIFHPFSKMMPWAWYSHLDSAASPFSDLGGVLVKYFLNTKINLFLFLFRRTFCVTYRPPQPAYATGTGPLTSRYRSNHFVIIIKLGPANFSTAARRRLWCQHDTSLANSVAIYYSNFCYLFRSQSGYPMIMNRLRTATVTSQSSGQVAGSLPVP